jgi:hypothetical protein
MRKRESSQEERQHPVKLFQGTWDSTVFMTKDGATTRSKAKTKKDGTRNPSSSSSTSVGCPRLERGIRRPGGGTRKPRTRRIYRNRSRKHPRTTKFANSWSWSHTTERSSGSSPGQPDFSSTCSRKKNPEVRKNRFKPILWTLSCTIAFKRLKNALCLGPVLQASDPSRNLRVQTDASDYVVGYVIE